MARVEKRLTAKQVAGAGPGSHADGGGLTLEADDQGRRRWQWRYRRGDKRRAMGLGSAHEVSLAEARAERDRWRKVLREGIDPIDARAALIREEIPIAGRTFGDAADDYLTAHEKSWRNAKHVAQWKMTLREYAAPIRNKGVAEISTEDVLAVLSPLWADKRETASRLRGRIETVLDAERARGHIPPTVANPARWKGHLDKLLAARTRRERGHYAAMPWREVPAAVAALRGLESVSARALEFQILTAARSGEVRLATIGEFDLDAALWIVPADRMKAGRVHAVPLAARAVEIVREVRETFPSAPFVFPGRDFKRPLSDMTLTAFLRRRNPVYTAHGFRSSFRDWVWEATNFPRDLAEAALAHVLGDATEAAYRRGDALNRRRELMRAWAQFIGGDLGEQVVPLRRPKAQR